MKNDPVVLFINSFNDFEEIKKKVFNFFKGKAFTKRKKKIQKMSTDELQPLDKMNILA